MKRTILAAALLMAAGCSSPEKARTVDPLRVATVVAAPSADAGAAIYVGTTLVHHKDIFLLEQFYGWKPIG